MLDFITKFFRREESSKSLAKERLRLVLMSDRVSLAPEMFDEMKGEMLAVIRRYLEIDERALDLHFENLDKQFALLASIPVLKIKTREQPLAWRVFEPSAGHPDRTLTGGTAISTSATVGDASSNGATHGNGANGAATHTRRRRRRRRQHAPPPDSGAAPGADPPA